MDKKLIIKKKTELALPNAVITENGMSLVINDNVTKEELRQIGKTLKTIESANSFWIGDWINSNWGKYERGKYDDAEKLGFEKETLQVYGSVASSVKSLIRIKDLSWSHHQTVSKFPEKEQKEWLQQAVDNNWSVRDLKKAIRESLKPKTPIAPGGFYKILYVDPPWKYSDELIENYGAVEHHYTTMSIEELSELKEKGNLPKTLENSVMFMWTTSPLLDDSFKIVEAWGFEYKTSFIWDKVKHNFGHYNSVRHEILLICTKGSCSPESSKLFDSVQTIERTAKHSEKPEEFRDIIDTLYPTGTRIEMFSRKTRKEINKEAKVPIWDVWGESSIKKNKKKEKTKEYDAEIEIFPKDKKEKKE